MFKTSEIKGVIESVHNMRSLFAAKPTAIYKNITKTFEAINCIALLSFLLQVIEYQKFVINKIHRVLFVNQDKIHK